jgi:hypothetical protein
VSTTIYFGRPGGLITLHHPRGGVRATRERPIGQFRPGDGGYASERRLHGARKYVLGYESLSREDFHTILAYDQGHMGVGPWALLDPGQVNMLTVNQSSATSHLNETDNFSVAGSGWAITSSAVLVRRGTRSLRMAATYADQTGTLSLTSPYAGWHGIPVADLDHTFSFYARTAVDSAISVAARIVYLDVNGATLSTTTGSTVVAGTGAWSQVSATANADSTAAYCNLSVIASGASAGALLYLDEFQFEAAAAATDWTPGTGVLPVVIEALDENWRWQWPDYRERPAFVLSEDTS